VPIPTSSLGLAGQGSALIRPGGRIVTGTSDHRHPDLVQQPERPCVEREIAGQHRGSGPLFSVQTPGVWCSGSTAASNTVCQGSNPCAPANSFDLVFAMSGVVRRRGQDDRESRRAHSAQPIERKGRTLGVKSGAGDSPGIPQRRKGAQRIAAIDPVMEDEAADEGGHRYSLRLSAPFKRDSYRLVPPLSASGVNSTPCFSIRFVTGAQLRNRS
jgi:hypothetical protein